MRFDEHGHLYPYIVSEINLAEFEQIFVEGLPDVSHRRHLFDNYLRYVNDLKRAFDCQFHQLLNGSFITTKEQPGDIDLVTFLPFEVLGSKNHFARTFLDTGKRHYKVDGYFAPICKKNHYYLETSKTDERY